jgi:GrpB-like predicted nucleotidyltransferase (UPF0157 family)
VLPLPTLTGLTVAPVGVSIVPYSDSWPSLFQQEAVRLHAALEPWLIGSVEHIGSTAVPGLAAKPILDMLGPVADLERARAAIPVLADLGYRQADHRPQEVLWFYAQQGEDYDTRTHQLHLSCTDSALWRERITFRDALRANADLLDEYQALKQTLAARAGDLTSYTQGKREFVERVLHSEGVTLG